MDRLFLLLLGCLPLPLMVLAQNVEPNDEGFFYDRMLLDNLSPLVDSLNQLHQARSSFPVLHATPQGLAVHVQLYLKNKKGKSALEEALKAQLPLKDFVAQYQPIVRREVLVAYYQAAQEGQPEQCLFKEENAGRYDSKQISVACEQLGSSLETVRWAYQWKGQQLEAFYFPKGLQTPLLPASYLSSIHYAKLLLRLNSPLLLPTIEKEPTYYNLYRIYSDSKAAALPLAAQIHLLDSTRRMHSEIHCGADATILCHAKAIAHLALHTDSCAVFLKAHLWASREYKLIYELGYLERAHDNGILELEQLPLLLSDLIVGAALQTKHSGMDNAKDWGRIWAATLAYSTNRTTILKRLLLLVQDDTLDAINRRRAAELYWNCLYSIPKKSPFLVQQIKDFQQLHKVVPAYLLRGLTTYPSTTIPKGRRG